MNLVLSPRRFLTAGVLLMLAVGCDSGGQALAPVRGKVYFKGMPLHDGLIVFTPDALHGTTGPLAGAEIQPDGTFFLRSEDRPGAVVGWHRVTVVACDFAPAAGPRNPFAPPRSLLPDKYRDPELSGLKCEVKAGKENLIDFSLD